MKHRARCTAPRADDGVAPREGRAPDRHLERAVGGFWLIDLARGAPRDERHHVHDRFDAPFVADDVNIAAASTNPDPASTTWPAHFGSSARYRVSAPVLTTTKLAPGCECQPKDPPGAILFSNIHTSDSPLVSTRACHLLESVFASISWNCPMAKTVLVMPRWDVARTVPPYAATAATTMRSASTNRVFISIPPG